MFQRILYILILLATTARRKQGNGERCLECSDPQSRGQGSEKFLVGYWGQNGAGPTFGEADYEKPLKELCETTKFDIVIIAFVTQFFDTGNKDGLPGLNLAFHCETPISNEYPTVLRCPKVQDGVKECQSRGKKVMLSIGGSTGDGTLFSPSKARTLAWNLWNLFLGGKNMSSLRPFGNAILDGVDLDIEGGDYNFYPEFVTELRMLMTNDKSKTYLLTGSPQCPYPDSFLGPEHHGKALTATGNAFDHLYVRFYNSDCHVGGKSFVSTLEMWLSFARSVRPKGLLVFIGLPAAPGASRKDEFVLPDTLETIYQKVKDKPGVGGFSIWDSSWDQNNRIHGRRYHLYLHDILHGVPVNIQTTISPTTSQSRHGTKPTNHSAATIGTKRKNSGNHVTSDVRVLALIVAFVAFISL